MELLYTYRNIMLEFLLELYVFYFLTTGWMDRRQRFWPRMAGGLAAVLVIALGMAAVYQMIGQTVLGRSAIYLVLFAVTVVQMFFCFQEPAELVLLCCCVAYAAQNLCYKLYLILWCGGEAMGLYDGWGDRFDLYYHLVYYAFFALAAAVSYFTLLRRIVRQMSGRKLNYRLFALCVAVLAVTVLLCSVEDIYFARLSTWRENRFDVWEYVVLRQSGNCFSVICCAVVLLLASKTIEGRALEQEVAYLQHAIRQGKLQYEISRDTIERINIKCHDIKYRLGALAGQPGGVGQEAVEDLQNSISIYDMKVETGNQLLDVLLTEKSLYCEQNSITFSCMVDGKRLSFMDSGDLYCLFGNIIDNALEALKEVPERQRRVIDLVVKSKGDMVLIQEENYYSGTLAFRDGLPVTTKTDTENHGFGTRSIRMIARKYGGELTASAHGGVYRLSILLSPGDAK